MLPCTATEVGHPLACDGVSDDTAAIQSAIDSQRVVYLPLGAYAVNDTLRLKPDTVLIGLHPGLTRLVLPNGSPLYQGTDTPKALLESARGGVVQLRQRQAPGVGAEDGRGAEVH